MSTGGMQQQHADASCSVQRMVAAAAAAVAEAQVHAREDTGTRDERAGAIDANTRKTSTRAHARTCDNCGLHAVGVACNC